MEEQRGDVGPNGITFIEDAAADEDFFGSHGRLAKAIASVIVKQATVKVIGLLGPWGSGKSTVIAQMGRHLDPDDEIRTHIFTYDAWLHQSDPPKRAFLERLVAFLHSEGLVKAADWQTEIDVLDRRVEDTETTSTPHLTAGGWMVLLSLILVPAGSRLIGNDWFKVMADARGWSFGSTLFPAGVLMVLSPLLMIAFVQLTWREFRNPFSREFWQRTNWSRYRQAHSHRSLLALFMNKQVQHESKRVIKTPEPTTIEFQALFRKLFSAVENPARRFVIVVDNLDRLSGAEAIAMWTTIRSFFLGGTVKEHHPGLLPTVILPIDETSVEKMFGASSGDAKAVKSFMDKTFDLTFHVTPPVSSDWHDFLSSQLRAVFGANHDEVWGLQIRRVYAQSIADGEIVTPRDLNKLVNGIASIWLQWRSANIPIISMAYFTIHRTAISQNVYAALRTPVFDIAGDDPDWQRSIAALHFGIEPEHAIQVLLRDRLGQALARGMSAPIRDAAAIKGFEETLLKLVDGLRDPDEIESAVKALAGANLVDAPWLATAWRTLRRLFVKFEPDDAVRRPNVLGGLAGACPKHQLDPFLTQVAEVVGRVRLPAGLTPSGMKYIVLFVERLWFASDVIGSEFPRVIVNGTAEQYLEIASALAAKFGRPVPVVTNVGIDGLVAQVAIELRKGSVDHLEQRVTIILDGSKPSTWEALIEAADHAARTAENLQASAPAIHVLASLKEVEPAALEAVQGLATDGWLTSRTEEALAIPDLRLAARIMALRMAVDGVLTTSVAGGWTKLVEREPTFPSLVHAAFKNYARPNFLAGLIKLATDEPDAKSIVRPVFVAKLEEDDLGLLYISRILAGSQAYLDVLPSASRSLFVRRLTAYDTFWENLQNVALTESSIRIYQQLISAPKIDAEDRQRARRTLLAALRKVSTEDWQQATRTGSQPLAIGRELLGVRGQPLALGEALLKALKQLIPELLEGSVAGLADRWFIAVELMSASTRRTLLRNLRDVMVSGADIEDLVGVVEAGGARLLTDGDFASRADDTMRHVVVPLMLEEAGQGVLRHLRETFQRLLERSRKDTREHLIELAQGRFETGDEAEQERLAWLMRRTGSPPPERQDA